MSPEHFRAPLSERDESLSRVKKKARPTVWKSEHYFRDFLAPESVQDFDQNFEQVWLPIERKLRVDLSSLFDEHVAQRAVLTYEYGPNGIRGGYSESMSSIAYNHVEYLRTQGLSTLRAQAEAQVAEAIEHWMADADDPHRFLVSISPRGQVSEGYPGYDPGNYVLINVYERDGSDFLLHQYRSYDSISDLSLVQEQLLSRSCAATVQLPIANPQHPELACITKLQKLPASTSRDQIESVIYERSQSWVVHIENDLPAICWDDFTVERDAVVGVCLQHCAELVQHAGDQAVAHIDQLVSLATDALAVWVHENASNYDSLSQRSDRAKPAEILEKTWELQQKKSDGQSLSTTEKTTLESLLSLASLPSHSPLNQLMSMAHCVTGTPLSLLSTTNLLQSAQLNQLTISDLSQLIGRERAELWHMGSCAKCGTANILVGECSWCFACEQGFSERKPLQMDAIRSRILSGQSASDHIELERMLAALFKKSITLDEFIVGDYIDASHIEPELLPIAEALYHSTDPRRTLEKLIFAQKRDADKSTQISNEVTIFQANV